MKLLPPTLLRRRLGMRHFGFHGRLQCFRVRLALHHRRRGLFDLLPSGSLSTNLIAIGVPALMTSIPSRMRARNMPVTYYVVVPFGRNDDDDLVPLEPMEAQSGEVARRRAPAAAAKHGGAIAFSRTGDPNTGDFGDATILTTYGEVDKTMLGERGCGPPRTTFQNATN